jgi:hypothetical protein
MNKSIWPINYHGTHNSNNELHSFNDEPSVVHYNGDKEWHKNGKLHRDNDQPAVVYNEGSKYWYKDGNLHRDNGEPAYICRDGGKLWYIKGSLLNKKQVELLKKIMASEIKHLPWLLNEDELLNCVIERRLSEG